MNEKNDFINKDFLKAKIEFEYNSLKGNMNRMCVTHDIQEFQEMYSFAKKRIDNLFNYNLKRIEAQ